PISFVDNPLEKTEQELIAELENGPPPNGRFNLNYVLPLVLYVAIELDSLYVMYQNGFQYTVGSELDQLYTHRWFPIQLRKVGDFIVNLTIVMQILNYSGLICHSINDKLIMHAFGGDGAQDDSIKL